MKIDVIQTALFRPKQKLWPFIVKHLPDLSDGSILVITSKIIALSQGRLASAQQISKEKLIRQESQAMIKTKYGYLTLQNGLLMPNAGVDESNANGQIILWPKNSYLVARELRRRLQRYYRLRRLGILITDSRVLPLRRGTVGVAVAYAGFSGLRNYIGQPDLFGRKLKISQTNIADGLAAAAVMLMGEGSERTPLALIIHAPVKFTTRVSPRELTIPLADDLYSPLLKKLISKLKK